MGDITERRGLPGGPRRRRLTGLLWPRRVEYDAYRVDLEELNLGPRDALTLPRLERAQKDFQSQRERYQRARDDLSVKVRLLQENKVRGRGLSLFRAKKRCFNVV